MPAAPRGGSRHRSATCRGSRRGGARGWRRRDFDEHVSHASGLGAAVFVLDAQPHALPQGMDLLLALGWS